MCVCLNFRCLNRLDAARPMEIRDLESLGPLVESSLRSDATAQGPWLSKSRISTDSASNQSVNWNSCQ